MHIENKIYKVSIKMMRKGWIGITFLFTLYYLVLYGLINNGYMKYYQDTLNYDLDLNFAILCNNESIFIYPHLLKS